jgi:hypothetical protein
MLTHLKEEIKMNKQINGVGQNSRVGRWKGER